MKPLLFETIKRSKFNKLGSKVLGKKYLIKEEDGSTTPFIGNSDYIVEFTVDEQASSGYKTDAKYQDIYDLLRANINVKFAFSAGGFNLLLPAAIDPDNGEDIVGKEIAIADGSVRVMVVTLNKNEELNFVNISLQTTTA